MKLFRGVRFEGFKSKVTGKKPKQPVRVEQSPQEAAEQTRQMARQLVYKTKGNEIKASVDGKPAEPFHHNLDKENPTYRK